MNFLLSQGELPIMIVQEHIVSSNVMGYYEYQKTWVLILRDILFAVPNGTAKYWGYAVALIEKSKAFWAFNEWQKWKVYENCIFFPESSYHQLSRSENHRETYKRWKRDGSHVK